MDRVVEARFRQEGGGWRVDLVEPNPDGGERAVYYRDLPWDVPDDPDALFVSIVPRKQCKALHAECVRLRVLPQRLEPRPGPLPPVLCWPAMYDPRGLHVYFKRWTLAEVCAPDDDEPWRFDGSVSVHGDPALTRAIRAEGAGAVRDATEALTEGTVLVAAGRFGPAEAAALQRRALAARCPLVVWTETIPAQAGRGLLELVPTGEPAREPTARYLARLALHLRAGRDPEAAVTLAASEQPHADLRARWLRGTFRPWRSAAPADGDERLRYWRSQIDRSVQQSALTAVVNDLVAATDDRRVHVVVVRGAEGAGVEHFRGRPIDLRADLADGVDTVRWEPPWAELPAETLDQVIAWNDAPDLGALVLRLVEHARESTLLVRCVHPTAAGLGVEALRGYVARLRELAAALAGHPVRVLVVCCVVTGDPEAFEALEDDGDAACAVSVLATLEPFIPDDELWDFLKLKGIVARREDFRKLREEMGRVPYESLVAWLANRFPEKLTAR